MFIKVFLKIRDSKTPMLECLFNKTDEETPVQVFSCCYCEIFKNGFLYRALPVAAFVSLIK